MIPSAMSECRGAPRFRRGAAESWGCGGHFGAPASMVAALGADDADERHALARRAAEVVREGEIPAAPHAGDLPLAGLSPELQPALEQHAQSGGADGMAERLESAVGIHGQLAVEVKGARHDLLPR